MAHGSNDPRPDTALDGLAWHVLTEAYLRDAWEFACHAGLDPRLAAEACEVTSIRLLELLDGPEPRCTGERSVSAWVVQTLLAEIHRARRLDVWQNAGRAAQLVPESQYPTEPDLAGPGVPVRFRSVVHDG